MRWLGISFVMVLTACGASADEAASPEGAGQGGTSTETGTGGGGAEAGANPTQTGGRGGSLVSGGSGAGNGGSAGRGGAGGSSGAPGSAGAAGSTAGQDAGAIVVRACSNLPAAGQWENISPPAFRIPSNMETYSVVVGQQDSLVYAAAGNKTNGGNGGTGVMRSTDCGATWTVASTGTNSDKLKSGGLWAMLVDPTDPHILYVANGYGNDPTIYKSTNSGVDFAGLAPYPGRGTNVFVQDIALEPAHPQHLAVNFHDNCVSPYTAVCFSQSADGGATWQLFNGPAQLGGWHEGATLSVLGPSSYVYGGDGAWYTGDGGQTWTKVVNDGYNAAYPGSTDIAPDGTMYLAGCGSIYSSHSNPIGSSWTQIANSPRTSVIIDDGVRLFASYAWGGPQPNWTAPLSNPSTWTHMPSPSMSRGSNQLAYDAAHHIVYSANWGAGLWRLVTR